LPVTRVGNDPCVLEETFLLDPQLARNVVALERMAEERFRAPGQPFWPGLFVISGQRSEQKNRDVGGSPNSLHMRCPSLAVDLRVGSLGGRGSPEVWAILGGMWEFNGWGRWGGRFGIRPGTLPTINEREMNHFDTGAF